MNPAASYIRQALKGYYPDSEASAMARLLLTEAFGMSAADLYAGKDSGFSPNERKRLDDILDRLRKWEPVQYIIGKETFCGMEFEVNRDVLIPRPETEELVDWVVGDNRGRRRTRVLDVGTGSGCIAVALARRLAGSAEVTAWDVSEAALRVAARNARRNGAAVRLERRDVLRTDAPGERFDVIVSNPPYVTERERAGMEPNVLDWEPGLALFVPDDRPLLFHQAVARLGRRLLAPGGTLYLEINRAYGRQVADMLGKEGYRGAEVRKDCFGNDRMARAALS